MKMKKTLAVLLALTMCLSLLPMSAFADYGPENKTTKISIDLSNGDVTSGLALTTFANNQAKFEVGDTVVDNPTNLYAVISKWEKSGEENKYDNGENGFEFTSDFKFNPGTYFENLKGNFYGVSVPVDVNIYDTYDAVEADHHVVYNVSSVVEGVAVAAPDDDGAPGTDSQNAWEAVRANMTTLTATGSDDSYINIAGGSYLIAGAGKLTLNKSVKLNDDADWGALRDDMDTRFDSDTADNERLYELCLKAGTVIAIDESVVIFNKTFTATLGSESQDFTATDIKTPGDGNPLSKLDAALKSDDNDKDIAINLFTVIDGLFDALNNYAYGYDAPAMRPYLNICFGEAAASTPPAIVGNGESFASNETTSDTGDDNASAAIAKAEENTVYYATAEVTLGSTDVAAQRITVKENTVIKVESSETAGTGENAVSTSEITYTPVGETETKTAVVVNKGNDTVALDVETLFTKDDSVKQDVNEAEGATSFSDFVQPAAVVANAVAATDIDITEITKVELSLKKTETTDITGLVGGIAAVIAAVIEDESTTAYEVHPVATIKTTTNPGGEEYTVVKEQFVENAQFTFKLNFGIGNAGKKVTLTHYASNGTIKQHLGSDSWEETIDPDGNVTITLDSFSYVVGQVEGNAPFVGERASTNFIDRVMGSTSDMFSLNYVIYLTNNTSSPDYLDEDGAIELIFNGETLATLTRAELNAVVYSADDYYQAMITDEYFAYKIMQRSVGDVYYICFRAPSFRFGLDAKVKLWSGSEQKALYQNLGTGSFQANNWNNTAGEDFTGVSLYTTPVANEYSTSMMAFLSNFKNTDADYELATTLMAFGTKAIDTFDTDGKRK